MAKKHSHVAQEICWYFLQKSGSEMTCITSGDDASKAFIAHAGLKVKV